MLEQMYRSAWRSNLAAPLAMAVISLFVPGAFAWDAGPEDCKHSECSDGVGSYYGSMWSGNTHLWLVNRAVEQLASMNSEAGKFIARKMNEPNCRTYWEAGLWDTDDKWVDAGKYPGSHFYNPRHQQWDGAYTKATTYLVMGTDQGWYWDNAEAKSQAASRIAAAGGIMSNSQCYQLGRALHYLTDMTQPMHTTSFSGLTVPTQLHPVWEMYVVPLVKGLTPVAFGDRFQANMPCASASNCTSDEVFEMTAWRTTDNWADGIMKILTAGDACSYTLPKYNTLGSCFRAYGPSDNLAKQILADAVPSVTAYLYSLRNNIARVKKTVSCGSNVYGLANAPAVANGVVSAIVKLENGTWQPVANTLPALDFVVGGANCLVWSMDKDRKVSGPTGGKTVLSLANSLAIGANGDVWMIDSDFVPAKLDPSDMQFHEPQGIGRTAISKIAVSPTGVVYGIVTASNLIHRLATNQWQNTSATAIDISFTPDGTLWAIGTGQKDFDKGWSTVPVGDNQGPFDANFNIQSMNPAGAWTILDGLARLIDASGNSGPRVTTRQGVVWLRAGNIWTAPTALMGSSSGNW